LIGIRIIKQEIIPPRLLNFDITRNPDTSTRGAGAPQEKETVFQIGRNCKEAEEDTTRGERFGSAFD